ncbi:agarase [Paenibacillus athensensis]|uniref:Agarase n=1 Tax=Paenibacillus athensensis TaxID=1967502 RepID=A0A4Y8PYW0_9BACL|nr:agarase [Paenibacillus athensensis]
MANLDFYGGTTKRQFQATGFFRLEKTEERWFLVDPDGYPFITVGVNHADETNLKYDHNIEIWEKKYGSRQNWIQGLVHDLKDWGFNTIGWTADYISGDWGVALDWFGDPVDLGHSSGWAAQDYKLANMPYCVQIRVQEIEDWNGFPNYRDVYSPDFDKYCDYLARAVCHEHKDSKNLIGYFLVDIPGWIPHASGRFFQGMEHLKGQEFDDKLFDIATKYYDTITKYIRKYDPNHLILGDRYNGDKGIPEIVLQAMKPYVDVLSVQYFPASTDEAHEKMKNDLARWSELTGKPVLIADIGNWCATHMNPNRVSDLKSQGERGADYTRSIGKVLHEPWFIGWHWCAHLENKARGWGIKDPFDQPYQEFVDPVREFNRKVYDHI